MVQTVVVARAVLEDAVVAVARVAVAAPVAVAVDITALRSVKMMAPPLWVQC